MTPHTSPRLTLGVLDNGALLAAVGLAGALVLKHCVVHRGEGKVVPRGADDCGRWSVAACLASQPKEKGLCFG